MPSALRKVIAVVFWLHVTAGPDGRISPAAGQNQGLVAGTEAAAGSAPACTPCSGPGGMGGEHVPEPAPSFGASGSELSTGAGAAGRSGASDENAGASSASHCGGSSSPSD